MKNFRFLLLLFLFPLSACAVTSQEKIYSDAVTNKDYRFNAKIDGMALTGSVYLNDKVVITQNWPPFVNSTQEKIVDYDGDKIKLVMKVIKGIGSTNVQMYIYVNNKPAGEFYF